MFETKEGNNKIGLGGWLSVWLVLNCLALVRLIFHLYTFLGSRQEFATLTNPNSEFYHPLWRPLLVYEFFCHILNPVAIGVLICLYASKSRLFPKTAIAFYFVNCVMVLIDAAGARIVGTAVKLEVAFPWQEIGRCLIGVGIWAPYFLKSQRVKATFIH